MKIDRGNKKKHKDRRSENKAYMYMNARKKIATKEEQGSWASDMTHD